ncbi:MAG: hypothetical protein V5A57_03550, partial [Candidatus Paceibacterota bacterium]
DEEYEFSLRHPENWATYKSDGGTITVAPQDVIEKLEQPGGVGGGTWLTMQISYDKQKEAVAQEGEKLEEHTDIVIDEIQAERYRIRQTKGLPGIEQGDKFVKVIIPHQEHYLDLTLLDYQQLKTFEQILDTIDLSN